VNPSLLKEIERDSKRSRAKYVTQDSRLLVGLSEERIPEADSRSSPRRCRAISSLPRQLFQDERCASFVTDVTLFSDDDIKRLYRLRRDMRGEHFERISIAEI